MPLPDDGPTTDDLVKAYVGIDDAGEDDRLAMIVPAVNAVVRKLPIVANLTDEETDLIVTPADFAGPVILGATMLAARFLRAHNSPDGVVALTEGGPVYIQRTDPNIAQMLGIGHHAKPAVG